MRFLTQFRRFMLMNNDATIARDPIKKCGYFLSLIEGPKVEGWTERMYEWLDAVHTNPHLLFGRTLGKKWNANSKTHSRTTLNTSELKMR